MRTLLNIIVVFEYVQVLGRVVEQVEGWARRRREGRKAKSGLYGRRGVTDCVFAATQRWTVRGL
jgi:hypothetical protein